MRLPSFTCLGSILVVLGAAACGAGGDSTGAGGSGGGTGASGPATGSGGGTTTATGAGGSITTTTSTTTTTGSGGAGGGSTTGAGGSGGTPCAAGTIQCDGAQKKVCDGNGGFTVEDCAATGQVCVAGVGCLVCDPGGPGSCNGDVASYCLPDGSGYATETCDGLQGTTCNAQTGHCDGACSKTALGKSYIGCDYFPTVTANIVPVQFHFAVAVSNTTANPATVTVTQGGNTIQTVTVAANSVQVIQLPWQNTLKGPIAAYGSSVKVAQGAYRLRSTQPVTVYQFNPLEYQLNGSYSYTNDASLLLPTNAWTGTYRVVARQHWTSYNYPGFYAVTASQDGTTVTVAPGPNSGTVAPGSTGIASNGSGQVTLNAGDVLQMVSSGTGDVTGTLVTADKPVQVIGGHQCTNVPTNIVACDHLEETMFPYETLANDYIVSAPLIPKAGNTSTPKSEMVRIVATKPNTTLTYDPPQAGAPTSIAQAGGWFEIAQTVATFQVSANEPILVAQYMQGQQAENSITGDPAMTLAVATSQFRKTYLFHAPTNYENSYVNIVAPTNAQVTLDGQTVGGFTPIGNTGYAVSRQPLSNAGNGNHTASSASAFGISVYGYGQYTSYWYPGGSDLTVLHQ